MHVHVLSEASSQSRIFDEHLTQDILWRHSDSQLIVVVNLIQWLHECSLWQAAGRSTTQTVWSEEELQRRCEVSLKKQLHNDPASRGVPCPQPFKDLTFQRVL